MWNTDIFTIVATIFSIYPWVINIILVIYHNTCCKITSVWLGGYICRTWAVCLIGQEPMLRVYLFPAVVTIQRHILHYLADKHNYTTQDVTTFFKNNTILWPTVASFLCKCTRATRFCNNRNMSTLRCIVHSQDKWNNFILYERWIISC